MARRTLPLAVLLASVAALVFGMLWGSTAQRYRRAAASVDELSAANSALQDSLSVVTSDLAQVRGDSESRQEQTASARLQEAMLLNDFELRRLVRMGLKDPVNELRHDLVLHPELIPYKGILGGTMGFTNDSIALLSTQWAFARFEDGHIAGRCLLSFEVGPGGRISWKVIAATLDQ
jgi:hypothetical protein